MRVIRRAPRAWFLALAVASLAAAAGAADARPKRRDAKLAFDRGVVAYQKGDFEGASAALGRSYQLEHDVDTLFAWAQAERKLEHCPKAMDLYQKLLEFKLPDANKTAVEQKLEECRAIVAAQAPRGEPAPVPPPAPPTAPPQAAPPAAPEAPPAEPAAPAVSDPPEAPDVPPETPPPAARAWYRDRVALALLGSGVVAGGVGTGFLLSAQSLGQKAKDAKVYTDAQDQKDKATSRGNLGLITGGAGIALVVGGVAWIFLHRDSGEQHTVTGWLAPSGGGLAITGPF